MAIDPTERVDWLSVMGCQCAPPSVECHRPPSAAPTQTSLLLVGLTASAVMRPLAKPQDARLLSGCGPSGTHALLIPGCGRPSACCWAMMRASGEGSRDPKWKSWNQAPSSIFKSDRPDGAERTGVLRAESVPGP